MKRFLISSFLCLISVLSLAANETVVVLTNTGDGIAETPTELKQVNPCSQLLFKVNINIPVGYVIVSKYEWFVNGISTYVNTTDPGNQSFLYTVISNPTNVYCKVTYQKQDGTTTAPSTSTTFTPIIKQLDFPLSISTSTPPPNYGCASSTVSYSLPETPCTGNFCDIVDNVLGNYNITWQAPSGWAQTSLTNNGSNVSFTPDATTSGNIIATIHLSCGYTETRTLSVSRGVEAPAFTASTFQGCNGSSTNISINPTCGAANYTYTIVGNSGVKFTSNNLQILTTTNTTVSVSMSGGSSVNSLKTKANYPNSVSSTESTSTLNVNSTKPSISATYTDYKGSHPVQYWVGNYNSVCNSYMAEIVVSTPGASSTVWSKVTSNPSDITWYPNFSGNGNLDFYFWSVNQTAVFQINAINGCGTTSNAFGFKSVDCTGGGCLQYSISPNPAKGTLNIEPNIPAPCGPLPTLTTSDISKTSSITSGTKRSITQVDIYDNYGNLKKSQVENKTQHVTIDLTGFKTGVYVVIISDGTHKERQQIIIQ